MCIRDSHLVDKYFQLSNLIIVLDSTDQKILQYETSGNELWLAPQWIEPTADGGILVAANKGEEKHFENSRFGVVLMQPAVYKLNYDSAENKLSKAWEKVFGNEEETANYLHRINKIIPITPEKKEFIAIGQQATGAFIGKGFMVKFTEDGDSLWRREYEFLTEDHREHMVNDIIPAPDSGYYLCGLISDFSRDTTNLNPPYHRGWLMKVDEYGCLIPGCEQTSTTDEIEEKISVNIYPNPAHEFLNFQIQETQKNLKCRILDNQGRVVEDLKGVNGGTTYFTPVYDLANGIYYLQIFEENSLLHSAKFVKQ